MKISPALRLDLKLLSVGGGFYSIAYGLGFLAANLTTEGALLGKTGEIVPLFPLLFCVLTHIAAERVDRVADRIVIEHGGYRRRVLVRMQSTMLMNTLLVTLGTLTFELTHSWVLHISPTYLCGALLIVLVFSTAGTVVAAALPHPIFSMALLCLMVFVGGPYLDDNPIVGSMVEMTTAPDASTWLISSAGFCLPWVIAAALLSPFAFGRKSYIFWTQAGTRRRQRTAVPRWANWGPRFGTQVYVAGITNPLNFATTIIALALLTGSALELAAKIGGLNVGNNVFYIFPGQIIASFIPTLMLATSVENIRVEDQERFFYRSKRLADLAQIIRLSVAVALAAIVITFITASLLGAHLSTFDVAQVCAIEIISSPGPVILALLIREFVRTPALVALMSFCASYIEPALSKFVPALKPWFPSSLFSAAAGGAGLYAQSPEQIAPTWVALAFVALVGIGPLVWKFWPRRKVS